MERKSSDFLIEYYRTVDKKSSKSYTRKCKPFHNKHYVMQMYDDGIFFLSLSLPFCHNVVVILMVFFLFASYFSFIIFVVVVGALLNLSNITIVIINYSFPLSQCLHVVCDMRCNFLRASLIITYDAFTRAIFLLAVYSIDLTRTLQTTHIAEKW